MTLNEIILRDILLSYNSSEEWQSDIGKRYNTSSQKISILLQKCDFHRHKKEYDAFIKNIIKNALNDDTVVAICNELQKNITK